MKKIVSLFFLLTASSSTFAAEEASNRYDLSKIAEYTSFMGITSYIANQFGCSAKVTGLAAAGATGLYYIVKQGEESTNENIKRFATLTRRTIFNALPVMVAAYKTASLPAVTNAFATRGGADSLTAIAAKATVVGAGMVAGNHLLNKALTQKK